MESGCEFSNRSFRAIYRVKPFPDRRFNWDVHLVTNKLGETARTVRITTVSGIGETYPQKQCNWREIVAVEWGAKWRDESRGVVFSDCSVMRFSKAAYADLLEYGVHCFEYDKKSMVYRRFYGSFMPEVTATNLLWGYLYVVMMLAHA